MDYLITFHTKWDDELYIGSSYENICQVVLKKRIEEGCYYYEEEVLQARQALEDRKAFEWMKKRRQFEYEGFKLTIPTRVE